MPTRDEAIALLTGPGSPFEIGEREVHGQLLRVYVNAPASLRDIWLGTAAHGDAPFLVYGHERTTYADAHRQVRVLARHLTDAGVGKGDRVAIGMRNYPEWVLAFWACQSIGAIAVSLNAWWTAGELDYGLTDSGTCALLIDGERLDRLTEVLARLPMRTVVVTRGDAVTAPAVGWAEVVAGPDPGVLPDVTIE